MPLQKGTRGCGTQAPRTRKNCMDKMERCRQMEEDPWTLDVSSHAVKCLGCKHFIKLDSRNDFYVGLWAKHRDLCKSIKILKGEPLPKRTRRTKEALAAAAAAAARASSPASSMSRSVRCTKGGGASASPSITQNQHVDSHASSTTSVNRPRTSSAVSPVSSERLSTYPAAYQPTPVYGVGVFPGYDPHIGSVPPQEYTWAQYSPYGFYGVPYLSYYPAATAMQPTPAQPPKDQIQVQAPPVFPITAEKFSEVEKDGMMQDDDEEVFAPADSDAKYKNRFRFSTRREIRTYFGGATLDSMAKNITAPVIQNDLRRNTVF
ncbi:hypothetical protein C0991_010109 [Blastosporella zonata]|nr:hypothetical protein C0991_010109 [Blastosporella zonata]